MLAYLISAYTDPAHLRRLVDALGHDSDFYIHVDLNVDDAPFRRLLDGRATFVRRHRVSWGGWQQVEYQAEMIRAALQSGRAYTHLVCLSGQDYPLWSNGRIHRFFDEHRGRQFIGLYNLTRGTSEAQRRKFTLVHPFRDLTLSNRWLKNKLIVASRTVLRLAGVRRTATVTVGGRACDVYFGSDYWALTPECAAHLLSVLESDRGVRSYFRTTFVPSELCLHTLLAQSPYAATARVTGGEYPGLAALTPLHFIDYGAGIRVLTLDDMDRLMASGRMFCRKVAGGTSDALADAIDRARSEDGGGAQPV